MKKIEISYNPYKMKTRMKIDGVDVCQSNRYSKIKEFIENGTPLQTWIEPVPYLDWRGFVNEISDPENNDEVKIIFSGRKIDFNDLQYAIEEQNDRRSEDTRVKYHYEHKKVLDDKVLSQNIEEVVQELKADRFRKLVEERKTTALKQKYENLEKNYKTAKESEFYIVFAGVYSSGKSTLLNTLIRHDVLPTSSVTCTSKNCRIKHNRTLGSKVSLTGYDDKNGIVLPKRIFESDKDCANAFLDICPINGEINPKYANVNKLEIEVDLSHLYPPSVNQDKFTIVLVDTPGMNSTQSSKNGSNEHAEIALKAISMESKPMIILCADAGTCEDKCIGEFMREIVNQTKNEGSGFNDRFLFLLNKSDSVGYNAGETAENTKERFARYLVDPDKWGIEENKEELKLLAESASHFVPRIFMTTARIAHGIQKNVFEWEDECGDLSDDDMRLIDECNSFRRMICAKRYNFYLSKYCDVPGYRKKEIEEEFNAALEAKNRTHAAKLQCGIVSVELAIRDYIERYAYPIKVRGLLETFEDILEDVDSFIGGFIADLQRAKAELGEKSGEREEAGVRKKQAEKNRAMLKEAEEKISIQLNKVDGIHFNSKKLKSAIGDLIAKINKDSNVVYFRSFYSGVMNTGQKSRWEVEADIKSRVNSIERLINNSLYETNRVLESIKKEHDEQINEILNVVKDTIAILKSSGLLEQGEYKFTDGVWWKVTLGNISPDKVISDTKNTIVDRSIKEEKTLNSKKTDWETSWNPFKKIGALFMDDYVYSEKKVDGSYRTWPILSAINNYTIDLDKKSKDMEKNFENNLELKKKEVKKVIIEIFSEMANFMQDIEKQKVRIEELGDSIERLEWEIERNKITYTWLNNLKNKIKGE